MQPQDREDVQRVLVERRKYITQLIETRNLPDAMLLYLLKEADRVAELVEVTAGRRYDC